MGSTRRPNTSATASQPDVAMSADPTVLTGHNHVARPAAFTRQPPLRAVLTQAEVVASARSGYHGGIRMGPVAVQRPSEKYLVT